MSMLTMIRDAGAEFGMAVGRGNQDGTDPDKIIDVQVAATHGTAKYLVAILEWLEANGWPDSLEGLADYHANEMGV